MSYYPQVLPEHGTFEDIARSINLARSIGPARRSSIGYISLEMDEEAAEKNIVQALRLVYNRGYRDGAKGH